VQKNKKMEDDDDRPINGKNANQQQ